MSATDTQKQPGRRSPNSLLIVGLGASAGGLEALEQFFANVPTESGIAFVVVTHQQPGRVSLMPELLARHSTMPVSEVTATVRLESSHVYLSPPGVRLAIMHGVLHPMEVGPDSLKQLPIDYFFRALAQDQGECAVGIVLSGTGSDGTLGLKEIKAAGGLVMSQSEASARYSGMPHSAIATELMDFVLPADELPRQLVAYARTRARRTRAMESEGEGSETIQRILFLLRGRSGHDFSSYKGATIRRRIERRIAVHQLDSPQDYLRVLQAQPEELDRLFKELLIGVTSFFRDEEAFQALAAALPELLTQKPADEVVRAWVPGCSTGEEAYSIAMLIHECMEQLGGRFNVQIFATDLDGDSIEVARVGLYPENIAADVSPARLERFFSKQDGAYRIGKEIRESLVFAPQNLLRDPPFTRLDLLTCRNVLIYLEPEVQRRLVQMFHYALKPGGLLMLGTSETVGGTGSLFEAVDKKWKIFRRQRTGRSLYTAELPAPLAPETAVREPASFDGARKVAQAGLSHVAERALLQNLVPPTVVMHERGEIVHIHGRTGRFLEPAPGAQHQVNIYNMLREGLQLDLAIATRQAAVSGGEVVHHSTVNTGGELIGFDLRVRKLTHPEALRGLFLVTFDREQPVRVELQSPAVEGEPAGLVGRAAELEREIQYVKEVHQSTVEELEMANEELRLSNEELQSTIEELQSTNEELETSKEEMHSLNEELQTVNAELQGKVEELSSTTDDMKNLLNATDVATIFLDSAFNIKRFTEQARRVIRLIASDIGRSIGDLVPRVRYTRLLEDAHEVLRTLVLKEADVQSEDGTWYLMRILPYRTAENVIDGVVITFVDITKLKSLQMETGRLLDALRTCPTTVFGQSCELKYEWVYGSLFGRHRPEVVGRTDDELLVAADAQKLNTLKQRVDLLVAADAQKLNTLKQRVLATGNPAREQLSLSIGQENGAYDIYVEPSRDEEGTLIGIRGVITDVPIRTMK